MARGAQTIAVNSTSSCELGEPIKPVDSEPSDIDDEVCGKVAAAWGEDAVGDTEVPAREEGPGDDREESAETSAADDLSGLKTVWSPLFRYGRHFISPG